MLSQGKYDDAIHELQTLGAAQPAPRGLARELGTAYYKKGDYLKAVESLKAVGVKVVGIIALVDRLEGGRETIEASGLPLVSIATRRDFMAD